VPAAATGSDTCPTESVAGRRESLWKQAAGERSGLSVKRFTPAPSSNPAIGPLGHASDRVFRIERLVSAEPTGFDRPATDSSNDKSPQRPVNQFRRRITGGGDGGGGLRR
jgi:hypothetical protein